MTVSGTMRGNGGDAARLREAAGEVAVAPDLVGTIRAIVRDQLASHRVAEVGVVTEAFAHADGGDTNNYECTVRLRDTGLELQRVPVATGRVGLAAIPNVDDLVLVSFVGGDLHGAVIIGRLYNDDDRPPEAKARECVYVSPDDAESGIRRAYLEFPNGNTLLLDDDKVVLSAGDTTVTINNGGDVQIDSSAKVMVKSSGNTEVTAQGDITLDASGSLSVKAGADVKIEGLSVSVKGQTSAQVEGGASATVKAPLISVAGTTSFSPG
jgi:phage baseplate assembly protein gpV